LLEYLIPLLAGGMLFATLTTTMEFLTFRYASRRIDDRLARRHESDRTQS